MNSEGGTLVIGVSDDHEVVGSDADLGTVSGGDLDAWEGALRTALTNHFDKDVAVMVSVGYAGIDGKTIALVKVDRSAQPIFMKGQNHSEFHVRAGNRSEILDIQAATGYTDKHFGPVRS